MNVIQKRLCVIINIKSFISSPSIHTTKRSGSDKDVDVIKVVFKKLNFTVLECKFDFKKTDLDRALNDIDDKNEFGDFNLKLFLSDCYIHFLLLIQKKLLYEILLNVILIHRQQLFGMENLACFLFKLVDQYGQNMFH